MENKGKENIQKKVQGIIDDGGEGIILRKHSSLYERGRTQNLVKLKVIKKIYKFWNNNKIKFN